MKHLLATWEERAPILQERPLMLFLDFDGTLAPIVKHPHLAKIPSKGKKALRDLAHVQGIKIAIVSGRSLAELKDLVRIPGLIYVGNHGLEMEDPFFHFVHPQALAAKKLMEKVKERLQKTFKSFSGILVEDKVFTLSVHYRRLAEEKIEQAKRTFLKILRPYVTASQAILTEGKKVWEVRPFVRWDKGATVLWLFGRALTHTSERILPIYVGDDRTDENAFRAIQRFGFGVKVIEEEDSSSDALYFLHSPDEVSTFLKRLKSLKSKTSKKTTQPSYVKN